MSGYDEPLAGDPEDLIFRGHFFFKDIEDYIESAEEASDALEKWIRKDRVALGLDPADDTVGLEDHRICDMVFARMQLDEIYNQLIMLERYWITFGQSLPRPNPE